MASKTTYHGYSITAVISGSRSSDVIYDKKHFLFSKGAVMSQRKERAGPKKNLRANQESVESKHHLPSGLFSISQSSPTLSGPPSLTSGRRNSFSWCTCWGARLMCYKWEVPTTKCCVTLRTQFFVGVTPSEQCVISDRKFIYVKLRNTG